MLVMLQPADALQAGSRRSKRDDNKLKNRVSMAFKKPFSLSKPPRSPESHAAPAHQPPPYSAAQPASRLTSRPSAAPTPARRSSAGSGARSNKPAQPASDGLVARRSHIGAGAVGTSPPLPPLPAATPRATDAQAIELLGADLSARLNPLLPRNSFGPDFQQSMNGLGIGIEEQMQSQSRTTTPSPVLTPPPQVEIKPLHIRRRSPSPPAAQQQRALTILGDHEKRRSLLVKDDGHMSEANRRLSMMKRGPPILSSAQANSSTSPLEVSASAATHAAEALERTIELTPPRVPSPLAAPAIQALRDDDAALDSRDRIAKLRGGRSSLSGASGQTAQAAGVAALRAANRKDAIKSHTIADAPVGFNVSFVQNAATSTYTPLKPLHLPSAAARSAVSLHPAVIKSFLPPPPVPPAPKSSNRYCLRPAVDASTQTPKSWATIASDSTARPVVRNHRRSWTASVSMPPQAYSSFPVPSPLPPPVPPHDTPPQKHTMPSPSIYSVASFDIRPTRVSGTRASRAGQASLFGDLDQVVESIEERSPEAPGKATLVNYDVPYLSPLPDEASMRAFDLLATPMTLSLPRSSPNPPAAPHGRHSPVHESTPTVTPVPRAQSACASASARDSSPVHVHDFARSRTPSPVPALSHSHSSSSDSEPEGDGTASSSLSQRRPSEPLTPPTSATSSTFRSDDIGREEDEDDLDKAAIVTVRKASLVAPQLRKASLVTPPGSRPQSILLRTRRISSTGSLRSIEEVSRRPSVDSAKCPSRFHLDLPGHGDVPPIPAVPSPIRRELSEAGFPFPYTPTKEISAELGAAQGNALRHGAPLSTEDGLDIPVVIPPTPLDAPLPPPRPSSPFSALLALDTVRPASAPPEESPSLPLRRQSESDKPILRSRTPGATMSSRERAAKGRSYFLVQALMGESQPEGMVRDWAKDEDEDSDDCASILGGRAEASDEEISDGEDEAN
ncbi:proteophosphoglycan ppg4 [Rhodotorula toruloides]|uniref:Proteophosphoglycan ppg4 n=1 Tax=Rhodotorula toruloides TaxID=5286 RepID=A0A511KHG9_RHOTO|nr:proteophosphoglycan ppg4 [Rhodotorula toruloides]